MSHRASNLPGWCIAVLAVTLSLMVLLTGSAVAVLLLGMQSGSTSVAVGAVVGSGSLVGFAVVFYRVLLVAIIVGTAQEQRLPPSVKR